jgi:peptide/nickel transport system permease protein
MKRFMISRLLRSIVVLWGISTVVFFVVRLSGDPVALMVAPDTPPAEIEKLRTAMGLDRPLIVQYGWFARDVFTGNFGQSLRFGEPAMGLVLERFQPTIELAVLAVLLSAGVGVPMGMISALKPNTIWDGISMFIALIGQSVPSFFLGIMMILIFSVQLRLLPTGGRGDWYNLIMPVITLGAWGMASTARLTRSSMLDVMSKDYIRTARAKGLSEMLVVVGHALKNVGIPLVTIIGLHFGALLGGAVVTETVFAWPGVGRLAIQAINTRDYPVVQACVFFVAVGFLIVNTMIDFLYAWLDPRIRLGS